MQIFSSWNLLLLLLPFSVASKKKHLDQEGAAKDCQCKIQSRPDKAEKSRTARWMVHSLDWGVLSTISTRLGDGVNTPVPFGNIYSYVDGSCQKSTGIPYMYGTHLDQSFTDSLENPTVSLSLTEASLSSVCTDREGLEACSLGTKYGDPELPVCARLTLTGTLVELDADSEEFQFAKDALFQRHSTMEKWPSNHNWVITKIDIQDIWLIDWFGGATILTPEEYLNADLANDDANED
jgi:hypothetical protein